MILISHRGNIDSIIIKRENTQSYIQDAIDLGYDVEIDVWYVDFLVHKSSPFWLGHDEPQCEVEVDWLLDRKDKLWVHCKNFEALTKLVETELRVFYHKEEEYTIISDKHIWAHNLKSIDDKCIIPLLSKNELENWKQVKVHGICSDYIGLWNG